MDDPYIVDTAVYTSEVSLVVSKLECVSGCRAASGRSWSELMTALGYSDDTWRVCPVGDQSQESMNASRAAAGAWCYNSYIIRCCTLSIRISRVKRRMGTILFMP